MYYFGCIGQAGHYLWANESTKMWMKVPENFPEAWSFVESHSNRRGVRESSIAPNCYGEQGLAKVQYHSDSEWTCVSFPDRSVDRRPNCVSAFIERGHLTFEEMMVIAAKEFPSVVDRYEFEVRMPA